MAEKLPVPVASSPYGLMGDVPTSVDESLQQVGPVGLEPTTNG